MSRFDPIGMRVLLVNPWVHDFKAFDFWNKPLGLLIVANILKHFGIRVTLLDCMDRNSPYFKTGTKTDAFGRGKYMYEIVEKPNIFAAVPRFYKRYGIPEALFIHIIKHMPQPDIVFVTSSMTYWYPGVFNAIRILKDVWPKTPIVLGGIYATLCTDHAHQKSGADIVLEGPAEKKLPELLSELGIDNASHCDMDGIVPDFSVYDNLSYGVVLTSRGCPFDCSYCATKILSSEFKTIPSTTVLEQLSTLSGMTDNIAFFDDALLFNKEFPSLLDMVVEKQLRLKFHASNGLHCRFLNEDIARKMYRADFRTMYLSLETVNPDVQIRTGGKVSTEEFIKSVSILKTTGFAADALHAYILYGMPGQGHEEVISSIQLCQSLSIHPHLCEFSPIPHTQEYLKTGFSEKTDPLYHNNLFYTWYYPEPKTELYRQIKRSLT